MRSKQRTLPKLHPGIATLEFVLVMPVLLFLFLLIFSFFRTHSARSKAIVVAKNSAWKARYGTDGEMMPENILGFDPASPLSVGVHGESKPGISRGSYDAPVRLAYFFRSPSQTARSTHFVLGGAYDHRNLRFDQGAPLVPNVRFGPFLENTAGGDFLRSGLPSSQVFQVLNDLWSIIDDVRRGVADIVEAAEKVLAPPSARDLIDPSRRLRAAAGLLTGIGRVARAAGRVPQMLRSVSGLASEFPDIPTDDLARMLAKAAGFPTDVLNFNPADLLRVKDDIQTMVDNIGEMGRIFEQAAAMFRSIGEQY